MTARKVKSPSLGVLALLVSFCSVGAVIISPALGEISRYFDIALNQSGQMMSVYLFGYALGQILYGPIADALGRKKSLFIAIAIALLGVMICLLGVMMSSFITFLLGRFIMALGSSAGLVVTFIMVNDTTRGSAIRKKMSILFAALAVAVPTTTTMSGYVQTHMGWAPSLFLFILYSIVLLVLVDYSPETGPKRKPKVSIDIVAHRYLLLLGNRKLIYHSIIYGCMASVIYVFYTLSPIIVVELLGITPQTFGMMNYFPNLGLLLGTGISAYISSKRSIHEAIEFGFCIMGTGVLFLILCAFISDRQVYSILVPMSVVFGGLGMIVGNIAALALSEIQDKPYATALYNFIALGISVFATLGVGFISHRSSLITLTVSVLLALVIMIVIFIIDQSKAIKTLLKGH